MTENKRKNRIDEIILNHVNMENLSRIKQNMTFPIYRDTVESMFEISRRKPGCTDEMTWGLMENLRTEGFVSPCPNNMSESILTLKAWNMWIDGFDIENISGFGISTFREQLFESPGFAVLNNVIHYVLSPIEELIPFYSEFTDIPLVGFTPEMTEMTESEFDRVLEYIPEEVVRTMKGNSKLHNMKQFYHCTTTGNEMFSGNDPLNPVLTYRESNEIVPVRGKNITDDLPTP